MKKNSSVFQCIKMLQRSPIVCWDTQRPIKNSQSTFYAYDNTYAVVSLIMYKAAPCLIEFHLVTECLFQRPCHFVLYP